MDEIQVKKIVTEWTTKDGKHQVMGELIKQRISPRVAECLATGQHTKKLRGTTLTSIELALRDNGLIPKKAS